MDTDRNVARVEPFVAHRLSRRTTLRGLGGAGIVAALEAAGLRRRVGAFQEATPGTPAAKATYTYKVVAQDPIRADVYPALGPGPHPVVVWLHPGGGMFGNRGMLHPQQQAIYRDAGYAVVAVDYRLAPETRLPTIVEDVQDALRWVRDEGPALFGADPARVAVVGHSSGGHLALLAGFFAASLPRAVVAFYAPSNLTGAWASTPATLNLPPVDAADAVTAVRQGVVSEAPPPGASLDATPRGRFFVFCFQQGIYVQALTGFDPGTEAAALAPYEPIRSVGAGFPPTLLLHGDQDPLVPHAESEALAAALAEAGVEHQLLTNPGGRHLFDQQMDDPVVVETFHQVLAFLARHLGDASPTALSR